MIVITSLSGTTKKENITKKTIKKQQYRCQRIKKPKSILPGVSVKPLVGKTSTSTGGTTKKKIKLENTIKRKGNKCITE